MSRQSPKLLGLLRRFAGATDGNVAIIFGIVVVPLITFIGAAVDYSRANMARTSMQAALDSAALMVSKDLSAGTITTAQVSAKAQAYFTALYTNKEASGITITSNYTVGSGTTGSTVQINASGSIATDFMKVVGFPNMGFSASSTATWGTQLLRVALVLDNTGSMADDNKIGALQSAAKNLVTQLSGLAKNSGDVYISVVPFEVDVNVGTSNSGASWLRWDMYDSTVGNAYCSGALSEPTMAQCKGHGYTWSHTPSTNKSKWNGCVTDRDQSNDVSSTAPSSQSTEFPADQDASCPAATVLPLTYNWTNINNTINQMSPLGGTNQTIGLQWGWLSLLQQSPLNAPAEDSTKQYQHIIILFTDGLNTLNRWSGTGQNGTGAQVDARMKMLCSNIKATGVTIFTVQIDTSGTDGVSPVLPACATDASHFFMLTSASQIASAFQQIGVEITKLRVAR
ncbi:MAG TPA: pilus assembly protein [Bradyrhizobium sp.]|jgi:Flp pilus assembly protein TadG|nr:pilus assembly protein [Bradyrhizobium sp.]